MKRYFAVKTKCGHVGKNKCIYIWFPIKAEDEKEAAAKARKYPRAKHDHQDAIREVSEISFDEYVQLRIKNANDPYLQCKNIQQQRKIDNLKDRIETDEHLLSRLKKPSKNRNVQYALKKYDIMSRDAIQQIREIEYNGYIAV